MTTLLLVRHGESEANKGNFFGGQIDAKLQPKGIEQAQITAEYIASEYKVEAVYASDLERAYKTGEIIASVTNAPIFAEKNLREINGGEWQGKKFDDLTANYGDEYKCWLKDIGNCVCPSGESIKELGERVLKALSEIAEKNSGKTVVIATHATPIRTMQCILSGYSLGSMKDIPWVSNASVTELCYNSGEWKYISIGADEHLSDLKTTFAGNV